jgi:hypothetical protein
MIVAIIGGLVCGLIVAYGVVVAKNSLVMKTRPSPSPLVAHDQALASGNHVLLLTNPEADEVVETSSMAVVGSTTPQSVVSVFCGDNYVNGLTDVAGAFSLRIPLNPGTNKIKVLSFAPNGEEATATVPVIFSDADLNATASASPSATKAKGK